MTGRSHPDTSDGAPHRQWNELLQEMRVMQTGVQILAAFLVVLPFQARFEMLSAPTKSSNHPAGRCHLADSALITPVAVHRYFFGQRLKQQTVNLGHVIVKIVGIGVGLLVSGCVWFVLQVLFGWQIGAWVGGPLILVALFLLLALPRILIPDHAQDKSGT
ncbi:DUF6328 family protein [Glutamicibacter nicotianae]|uniref:DUF6328 family protein n=1 Tax=Glutamicibacter nicotianae TaxID=37929 RepID=UPI00167F9BDE|nr:DUF6328 family protein [Glutamicibacter nicotianae]